MRFLIAYAVFGFMACNTGRLERGLFRKDKVAYHLRVPDSWRQIYFRDNDLAFVDNTSRFMLAVNSTCEGHDDAPLKVLLKDLLLGFEHRRLVHQEEWMLDGRQALSARYFATLDGVPTDMELTVLKKNGCVYDFVYLCPRGQFDEGHAQYRILLKSFRTESL